MPYIKIFGDWYEKLSEQETHERRNEFITNTLCVAGIDKLGKLLGHKHADGYFGKVFDNLKYRSVEQYAKLTLCPCIRRKRFTAGYVCYGIRCNVQEEPQDALHKQKSILG